MIETIASKHNLVCRQTVFNSILTSTLFVGFTVGSALGGYLSDKYGQVVIFENIFNRFRPGTYRQSLIYGLISPDLPRQIVSIGFVFLSEVHAFLCLVQMTFE